MPGYLSRRNFIKGLGAAAIAASGRAGAKDAIMRQPNVILVMTDDQGFGDLACHGNPWIRTPNLDGLHSSSLRLGNFHVSPTCAPTRAALLTGCYAQRCGVWHTIMGRSLLRRGVPTMADAFRASGYRAGMFGKWHLGDNYPFRPEDRGFDEVVSHGGGGVGQTPDYWGNDYFDDHYRRNGRWEAYKGYCTDVFFREAMRFIDENRDRPFFVYLTPNAPHSPLRVEDNHKEIYKGKVADEVAAFYGMITNFDENMGRLRECLKKADLEDDTILIFLTDNGSGTKVPFNAGLRGQKGTMYEGGHRVPCFIRWPRGGLAGGRQIDELTAHLDMLPTLIDLCGLKRPNGAAFDGISLAALLTGRATGLSERFIHDDQQRIDVPMKYRDYVVMDGRWRFINGELYDVETDLGQKNNLAKEKPEIAAGMGEAYERWWADVSRGFGEYCRIVIGSDAENPSRLDCMDWHSPDSPPWNQPSILAGEKKNGFWEIEAARDGRYSFALRRWPVEAGAAINDAVPGGKALNITRAWMKIGGIAQSRPVGPADAEATFEIDLKAGEYRLETLFENDEGEGRGAYYVHAERKGT
ncbi:MAG TPA: arylsulfatase [Candidatus Brocadiia bacterium]|nr:arylsulfatase [Candidatus Brocadiia bacterium]